MVLPFADFQFCDYRTQEIGEVVIVETAKESRICNLQTKKEHLHVHLYFQIILWARGCVFWSIYPSQNPRLNNPDDYLEKNTEMRTQHKLK